MLVSWTRFKLILAVLCVAAPALAQDPRSFRLAAPEALVETGFLRHLLPRFSLKHGIRITLVAPGDPAEAALTTGPDGQPVFQGPQAVWHFSAPPEAPEAVGRFADWLTSEVGVTTITAYLVDGQPLFSALKPKEAEAVAIVFDGDPVLGEAVARQHCARCHVVDQNERMNAIGSTPSFFALRTLPNWENRFAGFYGLNPHPAFTVIEDVTDPFDPLRPPPIVPLVITLEELDALLAFAASVPLADLGAPIRHQ